MSIMVHLHPTILPGDQLEQKIFEALPVLSLLLLAELKFQEELTKLL